MESGRIESWLRRMVGRFELYDRWYYERKKLKVTRIAQTKHRSTKDQNEKKYVLEDLKEELRYCEDRFRILMTTRRQKKAHKLTLSIPVIPYNEKTEHEGYWEFSMRAVDWYLTEKGVQEVRNRIRNEERERAELKNLKLGWIHSLTGVIGATIGLIAIIASILKSC